jgi:hypothetical protein
MPAGVSTASRWIEGQAFRGDRLGSAAASGVPRRVTVGAPAGTQRFSGAFGLIHLAALS